MYTVTDNRWYTPDDHGNLGDHPLIPFLSSVGEDTSFLASLLNAFGGYLLSVLNILLDPFLIVTGGTSDFT